MSNDKVLRVIQAMFKRQNTIDAIDCCLCSGGEPKQYSQALSLLESRGQIAYDHCIEEGLYAYRLVSSGLFFDVP